MSSRSLAFMFDERRNNLAGTVAEMQTMHIASRFITLGVLWVLVFAHLLLTESHASLNNEQRSTLTIALYKSDVIQLSERPSRVSVANPNIADIVPLPGGQVHIVGKQLGSTNVVFWNRQGQISSSVDIEVTHDLESIRKNLHLMLPNEPIRVFSARNKIILEGSVSEASHVEGALKIAESYLSDCSSGSGGDEAPADAGAGCAGVEVINLLSVVGAQQILLEVTVAEMSRTFLRSLDTDLNVLNFGSSSRLGAVNGGASFPNLLVDNLEVPFLAAGNGDGTAPVVGPVVDKFDPNTPTIGDKGLFFQDLVGDRFFQAALEISRSKGLAKVLAEPNLTTLTGRPAEFISGGEFPLPVPQDGRTSIVFKDFGVRVKFLPTILNQSRINLDLEIVVSEISEGRQVDVTSAGSSGVFLVPSLTKRGVSSTVELGNGQTIGIAGLIQDNVREVITKLPGLGDVPVLGQLFRSQEYASGQTELVIFVTAHLARPFDPEEIVLPTDSFVPPNDLEFYLLGRMESRKGEPKRNTLPSLIHGVGGTDGLSFGHDLSASD